MNAIRKIRWGIVGTGTIAGQFASDIAHAPSARLTAIASRQKSNADAFARGHGGLGGFDSLAAMLTSGDIDALYVATPNEAHEEAAVAAIEARIPLLVEKPLAANAATARRIADMARAKGVFLMEGQWSRHLPAMQQALGMVKDGRIGRLNRIEAEIGWPVPYDPESRFWRKEGGGVLKDLGVYPLSLSRFFAGPWSRVDGRVQRAPSGADRNAELHIAFESGATASIKAGFDRPYGNRLVLEGDHGVLVLGPLFIAADRVGQYGSRSLADWLHPGGSNLGARLTRKLAARLPLPGASVSSHPFPAGGLQFEIEAASRAILQGLTEEPDTPLADTIAVMEAIDTVLDKGAGS